MNYVTHYVDKCSGASGGHPDFAGKGFAKQMVRFAIDKAIVNGKTAIRLDVLKGNLPASHLYAGLGFKYIDTISMFYKDTGWTDYEVYEYNLETNGWRN